MMRLLQYDIEIRYKKGKDLHLADVLSRAYLPHSGDTDQFAAVNAVKHLWISPERIKEFKSATQADESLQFLKEVIRAGWPETKEELPNQIHAYFNTRDEYAVSDGLVFKGECVVVPESMRKSVKSLLHKSHLGVESTLRRARECVYWPSMAAEIKQLVES